MNLTADQENALAQFEEFMKSSKTAFVLQGSAGTGKTTLVEYILKILTPRGVIPIGIAPTHKAKRVLRRRMLGHEVVTLSSFLLKQKQHSYIGAQKYSKGAEAARADSNAIYILDEASMVTDEDFKLLERTAARQKNKILAIGDPYQIPPISKMEFVKRDDVLYRRPCAVFTDQYEGFTLTKIVRQAEDSPIIRVANFIRVHLYSDFSLKKSFPEFIIQPSEAYALRNCKIIAYTNEAVEKHNREVRISMGYSRPFEQGEMLMGYQNIGYPQLIIENGADYRVTRVVEETNGLRQGLVGWTIYLEEVDTNTRGVFFFPTVGASENQAIFSKLIQLANKVNQPRSTKKDYAIYRSLKDKLFFLQNIYEFPEKSLLYYTESQLKMKEPLLFTPVADLVDEKGALLCDGDTFEQMKLLYGDLMEARLKDDKPIAENETFASPFCILEKDLDYGYSITAHKAQASTMETVVVDETNFNKIRDRMNQRYGLLEDRNVEKNQLKYVACTRASAYLYLL